MMQNYILLHDKQTKMGHLFSKMSHKSYLFIVIELSVTLSNREIDTKSDMAIHIVDGDKLRSHSCYHIVTANEEIKARGMNIEYPAKRCSEGRET